MSGTRGGGRQHRPEVSEYRCYPHDLIPKLGADIICGRDRNIVPSRPRELDLMILQVVVALCAWYAGVHPRDFAHAACSLEWGHPRPRDDGHRGPRRRLGTVEFPPPGKKRPSTIGSNGTRRTPDGRATPRPLSSTQHPGHLAALAAPTPLGLLPRFSKLQCMARRPALAPNPRHRKGLRPLGLGEGLLGVAPQGSELPG